MKRCLIVNPYFAVLGGGERYTVALGEVIAESYEVTYASSMPPNPRLARKLGFPTLDVLLLDDRDIPRLSLDYDLAVVVALQVPPPSFAAQSLLIVQFPSGNLPTRGFRRWSTISKLRRYHRVVYSEFVREQLVERWKVNGEVLMPGVALADDRRQPKRRLILSVARFVGRFSDDWNNKRQDVLIDAFSKLPPHLRDTWHLALVGGCAPSVEMDEFIEDLGRRAAGLNISIEVNASPERLLELRGQARFFWHAAGFERPPSDPERAEHFGMSTIEAMSDGVIPLVYADGGQLEIVTRQVGRLWRSIPELVDQTAELMEQSPAELDTLGEAARSASTRFGSARFETEARELLARVQAPRHGARGAPAIARSANLQRRKALLGLYRAKQWLRKARTARS